MPTEADDELYIYNSADITKVMRFDCSNLDTGTISRVFFPEFTGGDYTFPVLEADQVWSGFDTFTGSLAFGPSSVLNYTLDGSNATGLAQQITVPECGAQAWMPLAVAITDDLAQGSISQGTIMANAQIGLYRFTFTVSDDSSAATIQPKLTVGALVLSIPTWSAGLAAWAPAGILPLDGSTIQGHGSIVIYNDAVQNIDYDMQLSPGLGTILDFRYTLERIR